MLTPEAMNDHGRPLAPTQRGSPRWSFPLALFPSRHLPFLVTQQQHCLTCQPYLEFN